MASPVLLDIQGAQSLDHRERGVARYVRELALAVERMGPASPVRSYLLNPDLPLPAGIEPLVASGKLRFVDEPGVYRPGDVLHLASPVELSIPLERLVPPAARAAGVRVVCTVFDLIPLAMPDVYLEDPGLRRRYAGRLELLRSADGLIAISEFVAGDVVARLGVNAARVTAVPLVASASFRPDPSVVREPVVLTTGGSDGRKNLEGMVGAWAQLSVDARRGHRLVVVGALPPLFANHLRVLAERAGCADSVSLTGFVSEDELVRWNQRARLVVFPSLAEGFGLPIAEAVACGTPVIAGDNTAAIELLPPEHRFDATSPAAMAAAIDRALADPPPPPTPSTRTWDDVAAATTAFCEGLAPRETDRPPSKRVRGRRDRFRLAFVSPLPPQPGGIADYSARLLEHLADHAAVDVFVDGPPHQRGAILEAEVPAGVRARPVAALDRVEAYDGSYDGVVYCLGNSEFHTGALAALLVARRPGVVLAHDVRLTNLYRFAQWQHPAATPGGFHETLHRMYPDRLPDSLGQRDEVAPEEADRWGLLMAREVIAASTRFATTSSFAATLARLDARPEDRERVVELPFAFAPAPAPSTAPVGAAPPTTGPAIVASFGVVNQLKQGPRLVEAFAATTTDPAARLVFVGPAGDEDRRAIEATAARLGVVERVELTGGVSRTEYEAWLERATVAVQLRATTNGESSAAVGDCLAHGRPTIVTGIGAARDLPADVAIAVPADVDAVALAAALDDLLRSPERRRALGAAAATYAADRTFAVAADALYRLVSSSA